MRIRLALSALVLLWWAAPADAHRLDEYLQATTIAVEKDHLVLQLRLTPGVAAAAQVLASLGGNAEGAIPDAEQRAYAERVRQDLSLVLNESPLPLRLVSASFPGAEEITGGLGNILVTFEADLPKGSPATRRLTFENHHLSAIAVYLVNCLMPRDPGIHIVAQDRSYDQARYQLDYTVEDTSMLPRAAGASANALPQSLQRTSPPVNKTLFRGWCLLSERGAHRPSVGLGTWTENQ